MIDIDFDDTDKFRKSQALDRGTTTRSMTQPSSAHWFVYILRCADGSLYTGITNDVARRCKQHNAGVASRYTRSRLPTKLVYEETQANRSLALKREAAIKALSRSEKKLLIKKKARAK